MGWIYTTRQSGESVRAFFERAFNYRLEDGKSGTIIASSVQFRVAYFAYRICTPGQSDKVTAIVCLLDYRPKDFPYNFGYKDMGEEMGPCESRCPERILKLLTPTDSEFAKAWRQRCWDYINKRKGAIRVRKYQWVKFSKPIRFTSGTVNVPLQFVGHSIFQDSAGFRYRLNRNWRITEQFKIVKNPA